MIKPINFKKGVHTLINYINQYYPVLLIFFIYSLTFSLFLLFRFYSYQSEYYDLGTYSYSFQAATRDPSKIIALIMPTHDSLIGHLSPFQIFILPLYMFWSSSEILLVINSVALGMSVFPAYLLARNWVKDKKMAILFSVLYLLHPLFHNINRYDFHPISFAPLLILSAIYFYERNSKIKFLLSTIFACALHEFMGVIIVFMSLSLILKATTSKKKNSSEALQNTNINKIFLGLSSAIIGIIYFLSYIYIQRFFDPSTPFYNWIYVGVEQNFSLHVIQDKIFYVILMFAPYLFVPFFEPLLLIPLLPYFGVLAFSNHAGYWSIFYQYGAYTSPFIFYATVVAINKFCSFVSKRLIIRLVKRFLCLFLLSTASFSIIFSALSPISGNSWSIPSFHDQLLSSLLQLIPKNSSVGTQSEIYPHLVDRSEVVLYINDLSLYGRISNVTPDFLVLDITKKSFYSSPKLFGVPDEVAIPLCEKLPDLIAKGEYRLYACVDGAVILKKNYNNIFSRNMKFTENVNVYTLSNIDNEWFSGGTYKQLPNGVSIIGGEGYGGFFYSKEVYLDCDSFSVSYALQQSQSYGPDSWGGLVLGFKDFNNYLLIYLRYPGGFISLVKVVNGISEDRIIGTIPYPSSSYQYFYLRFNSKNLDIYVNSDKITTIEIDPDYCKGHIGFANWQQDTNIQMMHLTILKKE